MRKLCRRLVKKPKDKDIPDSELIALALGSQLDVDAHISSIGGYCLRVCILPISRSQETSSLNSLSSSLPHCAQRLVEAKRKISQSRSRLSHSNWPLIPQAEI